MGLLDQLKAMFSGDKQGGGILGEPGETQRPGAVSGGPGDGPSEGGSVGPAGADAKPD